MELSVFLCNDIMTAGVLMRRICLCFSGDLVFSGSEAPQSAEHSQNINGAVDRLAFASP